MRMGTILEREQVESLRPGDVRQYLLSRGWVAEEGDSQSSATAYTHPDFGDVDLLVPTRTEIGDYALRMAEVARSIASIESRPIFQVLGDLSLPPADILRLRVQASETTLGSLPLESGIQLYVGGKDLLLSSACSTTRPQAFHPEKSLSQASEFIQNCRLGQTERGSYVATILAPVPPAFNQDLLLPGDEAFLEATEPYPRRVTTRLMNSLSMVNHAVRTNRLEPILSGVTDGVSANLCEAVVHMKPFGDRSKLEITMSWSRSRPRIPKGIPKSVVFSEGDFEIIGEAGKKLRERAIPRRERFLGKVFSLQSEIATLFHETGGKITIRTSVGGQPARVKVVLNRSDYKAACDAHRDDRRVAVTGMIHHDAKIRVYELSEPEDFEVHDYPVD